MKKNNLRNLNLNIETIKNWRNDSQLEILADNDLPEDEAIPGQLAGIDAISIPEPIVEEKLRGYVDGCPVYGPVTVNHEEILDARLYNKVASVLRRDEEGVYYIPVTDGEGEAFWCSLNEVSESWQVQSALFADEGGYRSAFNEDSAEAMAARLRNGNPGHTFDVVYKQRQVTTCDWVQVNETKEVETVERIIDIKSIYGDQAKLDLLPKYESLAVELAGKGHDVILTGAGPVWMYLRLAHALHGKCKNLTYDSPVTGHVVIFDHNPM
jgi:hypothetical protein